MTLEGRKLWEEAGEETVVQDDADGKEALAFSPSSSGSNYVFVSCVGNREKTQVSN